MLWVTSRSYQKVSLSQMKGKTATEEEPPLGSNFNCWTDQHLQGKAIANTGSFRRDQPPTFFPTSAKHSALPKRKPGQLPELGTLFISSEWPPRTRENQRGNACGNTALKLSEEDQYLLMAMWVLSVWEHFKAKSMGMLLFRLQFPCLQWDTTWCQEDHSTLCHNPFHRHPSLPEKVTETTSHFTRGLHRITRKATAFNRWLPLHSLIEASSQVTIFGLFQEKDRDFVHGMVSLLVNFCWTFIELISNLFWWTLMNFLWILKCIWNVLYWFYVLIITMYCIDFCHEFWLIYWLIWWFERFVLTYIALWFYCIKFAMA